MKKFFNCVHPSHAISVFWLPRGDGLRQLNVGVEKWEPKKSWYVLLWFSLFHTCYHCVKLTTSMHSLKIEYFVWKHEHLWICSYCGWSCHHIVFNKSVFHPMVGIPLPCLFRSVSFELAHPALYPFRNRAPHGDRCHCCETLMASHPTC